MVGVYYKGCLLKGGSLTVDLYYRGCLFRRFILQWVSIIWGVFWGGVYYRGVY